MAKLYFKETSGSGFNAGFKARNDVDTELERAGYTPLNITIYDKPGTLSNKLKRLVETVRLRYKIGPDDDLFFQYPLYTYRNKLPLLRFILGRHKGRKTLLVHDIVGYKEGTDADEDLRYLIAQNTRVIAHTRGMADRIEKDTGLAQGSIGVLNLFDYLTDDNVEKPDPDGKTIIFAGNLAQCGFLSRLDELPADLSFNIYGVYSPNVKESATCHYCGKFEPDRISAIKGNWGLVWHGPALETSAGNIGEYLRIISSHKISLYLAACKPVILWDESSVADFVVKNKLGIAVSSLFELDSALDALTDADKEEMAANVLTFSQRLRSGEMLAKFLKE